MYRGEDAIDALFNCLDHELESIREDLKDIRPLEMTGEDWTVHNNADKCWICNSEFHPYASGDSGGMWKVKDHDHITGERYPTLSCLPVIVLARLLPGVLLLIIVMCMLLCRTLQKSSTLLLQPTTPDRTLPHSNPCVLPQPQELRQPPPNLCYWTQRGENDHLHRQGRLTYYVEG